MPDALPAELFQDASQRTARGLAAEGLLLEQQAIFDNAGVGILFTRGQHVLHCNKEASQLFGWPHGDMANQRGRAFFASDADYEALNATAAPTLANGERFEAEVWLARRGEGTFLAHLAARAVNPQDTAAGTIWIVTDVTALRAQEAAARELLRHHTAIFENASAGILFSRNRVCETCNPALATMFGYASPAELVGVPTAQLFTSPEDYARLGDQAAPLFLRGQRVELDWEMRRRDGSRLWVHLLGAAIGPGDLAQGTIWITEDITQRRQAEQVLRQTLLEQEAILENASAGIVFLKDRRILRCNRRFGELLGRDPAQLVGQSTRLLYPSDEAFERAAGPYSLLDRGSTHAREEQLVRSDGSLFWCRLTGRWVDREHPERESVWLLEDVTEQRLARDILEQRVQQRTMELAEANQQLRAEVLERMEVEERVRHLANHDALTNLPNRRLLLDRLGQALALARRAGEQVAVMFLDLDRFKTINDSLGHQVGDELLRGVATRLAGLVRDGDTVARLGGDEFVMVLPRVGSETQVALVAAKLMEALALPFQLHGRELHVTPSIGIALYPGDGETAETLLRNADSAMYHAKEAGRDTYQFFAAPMNVSAALRLELENDLHHALERGELVLHYQPRVDLLSGRALGLEALIRWQHPRRGLLHPNAFVPLAEETGLITRVGEWVLHEACAQIVQWQSLGLPSVPVAINLSPRQFRQRHIAQRIGDIVSEAGVSPQLLELEITESTLMQHTEQTLGTLDRLHRMGLALSIDDFGIGYSSLSYLKRFPVDQLKIDQSFIRDLDEDPTNAAIVSAVVTLAANLGLSVVAEGVETPQQLAVVRRCGCTQAQGFLFSRAVPADRVPALLKEGWPAGVPA
ncbi:sensor domain-containing protein [Ideonella sp. BN130291]|uniref:sensor domain-containing protein n=1 Tax=Ideonella sp. BN130291 TaxID=3112940 RepID=UPI002E26AC50|nr:EAL domain-containing protein [Ideonella sp. BN130291]